jgi:hypothetical protein
MSVTKRLMVVVLALTLVMSSVFLGCAKELSAQEIQTNALSACPEIDTFRMEMNITADIEVIGGDEPGRFTMLENLTGLVNVPGTEMEMTGTISIDIPDTGKQDISMGIYIVSGWMYMRMDLPQVGEQWMKMKLNTELWTAQNQLSQQVEFLKTAVEVTLLGSEKVDGVDCYVLQIKPDMEALTDWVLSQQQQQSGIGGVDLSKLDLSKLFKTISIKEWIAKDTYLPAKADLDIVLEMLPEDIGATAEDFEKMTINMKGQVKYYDYNKPVTIELPQEALNAQEIPTK